MNSVLKKLIAVVLAVLMIISLGVVAIVNYVKNLEKTGSDPKRLLSDNIVVTPDESMEYIPLKSGREDEGSPVFTADEMPADTETPVITNMAYDQTTSSVDEKTTEPKKNKYVNENNEITVPFDIAFPEEFESGEIEYDEETILIKMKPSFGGKLTDELKEAGVAEITSMFEIETGKWYLANVAKGTDIEKTIENLRGLNNVLVAEYNFKMEAQNDGGAGTIVDASELNGNVKNNQNADGQWHLKTCGIQDMWKYEEEKGLKVAGEGVIVAVIDTGVDYTHEDLATSMWYNEGEIPDNGKDDDGNGYIDDYYGYNVTTKKGSGMDDNGHGTHVAGIIAAANNKKGIVGVAYKSKIMAVKAGQASGYFLASDVVTGINYALRNGADVINMSFGGSAITMAEQDALANAYTKCILVASAGNDGVPNEYVQGLKWEPNYPAALSYVLGVMSVGESGRESQFTNWDVDGFNNVEYEVYAPGEQILSTLPGDKYAKWSGTSMAAPVVSAIAANLKAVYSDADSYPTKYFYGQLASTGDYTPACYNPNKHGDHNIPMLVDGYNAFTVIPKPDVNLNDYAVFDSVKLSSENNGDGVIDAGETISLGLVLKNSWGMSRDTIVTIDAMSSADIPNPYVTFGKNKETSASVSYGGVGTYSTKDAGKIYDNDAFVAWEDPFIIHISKDCPNDTILVFNVHISCKNGLDESDNAAYTNDGKIELTVRRGTVVPDVIREDLTLTADKLWIIPKATIVMEGATLTVEAGTNIQFYSDDAGDQYAVNIPSLSVEGKLLCKGTEDNYINIYPSERYGDCVVKIIEEVGGYIDLEFCKIANPYLKGSSVPNVYTSYYPNYVYGCEFYNNYPNSTLKEIKTDNKVGIIVGSQRINIYHAEKCKFGSMKKAIEYTGFYNDCIFDNCLFKTVYSTFPFFENCVFLANNLDEKSELAFTSYLNQLRSTPFVKGKYLYTTDNSINGFFNENIHSDRFINETYEKFAEYIGGHLAYFETLEEFNEVCHNFTFAGAIGLKRNPTSKNGYKWLSGEDCNDFILDYLNDDGNTDYGYIYPYISQISFGWKNDFIIEFEDGYPDFDTTFKNMNQKIKEFNRDVPSVFIQNCAILGNNFNFDKTKCLTISAPTDSEHRELNISQNYWGTTNEKLIEAMIYDFSDDTTLADLNPYPVLTEAPEDVWPFVVDAGVMRLNAEEKFEKTAVVGNESVLFYVDFNRDMDTTIPLSVKFGSSAPYAEYQIDGNWLTPRHWEGIKTLTTTIENGSQYFSIGNGKAADSFQRLSTDEGRFTFEIDTSAAQAMIMQGEATDDSIKLSWFQDDFETLAGYNVYRSTEIDGLYTRLNKAIIPAEEKEFTDYDIEPGEVYYYNFTVVQTDMTESTPSGKITIAAKDTMAPDIYHTPVYNAFSGKKVVLSATVTDNVGISSAKLFYKVNAEESEWKSVDMLKVNDKYYGDIPAADVTLDGILYYFDAFDGINHTYKGSEEEPFEISVQLSVDDNDKGDVNADGKIDNLDALMVLQSVNNLLNLSAEEFVRADLDSDGKLSSLEALTILQYASGKISSVLF